MAHAHIVSAGCSFTKDCFQKTWPAYLEQQLKTPVVNIGARGAGIDFITKRIMYYCTQHTPDLMVVMFPSVDRFDWFIDTAHPLKDAAVDIASWQNGSNPTLINLDGTLSTTEGYCLSGGEIRGFKKHWFKYYYSEASAQLDYWMKIYQLQIFLESKKIPYCFSLAYDRDDLVEQPSNKSLPMDLTWIYNQISWNNFAFYKETQGFLSFVQDNNFKINKNHPESLAHDSWVQDILLDKLKSIKKF